MFDLNVRFRARFSRTICTTNSLHVTGEIEVEITDRCISLSSSISSSYTAPKWISWEGKSTIDQVSGDDLETNGRQ
ncbi:hypothetical protein DPMN_030121 [Dreissena polymorpha]|uniref:Uncharacterized protein n=1 Tax=Dreissena polymorpha TaxID=45954 RepID=A0A9D4M0I0_DREPO|nr:hypothetical protein DPMN_030121 [Dreissena polymorpha]